MALNVPGAINAADRGLRSSAGVPWPARQRLQWWQGLALCILVVALATSGPYGFVVRRQPDGALLLMATPARAALYWLTWAAAIPMLIAASRIPLDLRGRPGDLLRHVGLAATSSAAHALLFSLIETGRAAFTSMAAPPSVPLETARGLWDYLLFLTFVHMFSYRRTLDDRERIAAHEQIQRVQLETALARAELDALQSQLHPHFLFNTLNAISVLIPGDPARAQAMTAHLGALLRAALQRKGDPLVPLRDELELLDRYLAIERARFEDRLHVDLRIDEDAMDALIPTLLMQPLVENAIRHAVALSGGGRISVSARRVGDVLELAVEDPGHETAASHSGGTGVGLVNIRQRLALVFGNRFEVRVDAGMAGGTTALVTFPFIRIS